MARSIQRTAFVVLVASIFCVGMTGCRSDGVSARASDVLSESDVKLILQQAEDAANAQRSLLRVNHEGEPQSCRMHIIVMNRNARVAGRRSMDDAWHGSLSIAAAKAYTAVAFSSDENALTTRTIGALSQPGGPLWNIGNSNTGFMQPGLIEFPGGVPLYKNGRLIGAIGVSGDGVEEDERVALAGARGFEAPHAIRIDTVTDGALPYVNDSNELPAIEE